MLKRLLFPSRPAFLLPKTVRKATRDPGVRGTDIRVWERCRPGCLWIPTGGAGKFIRHVREYDIIFLIPFLATLSLPDQE